MSLLIIRRSDMAVIAPLRQDIEHPESIKKNSSSLRFWHWANTIVITGSLLTVLVNSTVLDEDEVGVFVKDKLQTGGTSVTEKQVDLISHGLSDKVWAVHIWFGYFLAALFVFRLVLELFQLADQKFISKLKQAYRDYFILKKERRLARHELAVKALYSVFYFLLLIMVVTGLTLAFKAQLHIARPLSHSIKEVHGFCMYLIIAFIVVHIAGVLLAERKDGKGIVSDMINGGQQ